MSTDVAMAMRAEHYLAKLCSTMSTTLRRRSSCAKPHGEYNLLRRTATLISSDHFVFQILSPVNSLLFLVEPSLNRLHVRTKGKNVLAAKASERSKTVCKQPSVDDQLSAFSSSRPTLLPLTTLTFQQLHLYVSTDLFSFYVTYLL